MKIDMHSHTKGSDGTGTPQQIVAAALAAKLDGICLTDHHKTYTPQSLEVAAACRQAGLLVIAGCEYSSEQGHILVYGVNIEDMNLGRYAPMQRVLDEANERGGIAIPSHPYKGYQRVLGDGYRKLKGLKILEMLNGQNQVNEPKTDDKAKIAIFESRKKLKGIGGSDAHFPDNTGICYTEFEAEIRNEREFIWALQYGDYWAVVDHERVAAAQQSKTTSLDRGGSGKYSPRNARFWNDNSAKKVGEKPCTPETPTWGRNWNYDNLGTK